ncbi:MAG: hypothetical protein KDI68_07530 [Gammaproteobacteria bacterium]|nr:hypothetical protein [Gammaproteobacteria bacterium]
MKRINFTLLYVAVIGLVCLVSLLYVLVAPPQSLRMSRDGIPFFTPPVAHPVSGEALDLGELVRHFKGE